MQAELDEGTYPIGIKVRDQAIATIDLKPDTFHENWNYCILLQRKKKQPTYLDANSNPIESP